MAKDQSVTVTLRSPSGHEAAYTDRGEITRLRARGYTTATGEQKKAPRQRKTSTTRRKAPAAPAAATPAAAPTE